jgi:hypothetical protein
VTPAVATCDHLRITILDTAAAHQPEPPPKYVADSDREGKQLTHWATRSDILTQAAVTHLFGLPSGSFEGLMIWGCPLGSSG